MGTYPKYQKGSEIGDNILDTAVGELRNPNLDYFCGDQNISKRKAGRPTITYTDILQQDTGLYTPEIRTAKLDRSVWKVLVV